MKLGTTLFVLHKIIWDFLGELKIGKQWRLAVRSNFKLLGQVQCMVREKESMNEKVNAQFLSNPHEALNMTITHFTDWLLEMITAVYKSTVSNFDEMKTHFLIGIAKFSQWLSSIIWRNWRRFIWEKPLLGIDLCWWQ